jgi:hypothetical protein
MDRWANKEYIISKNKDTITNNTRLIDAESQIHNFDPMNEEIEDDPEEQFQLITIDNDRIKEKLPMAKVTRIAFGK